MPEGGIDGRITAMKSYHILVIGAVAALVSCTQPAMYPGGMGPSILPKENPAHRQYLALPGQGAVNTQATDTDAAFDEQVAAYGDNSSTQLPEEPVTANPVAGNPIANSVAGYPSADPATVYPTADAAAVAPAQPTMPAPAPGASAGYAVQINNGTDGRIFVEVHDDSDNIFPVASMYAGQKINTQPQEPRPIQGQLTVIVKDPDQPGAPVLRSYKVTPPAGYMGKTVGITILKGGRYRASLDGEVYYTSPDPANTAQ